MTDNSAPLAQFTEKMRARRQEQQGGVSPKQISWIVDGYNLGYLTAEECKARFGQLIDELDQRKSGE